MRLDELKRYANLGDRAEDIKEQIARVEAALTLGATDPGSPSGKGGHNDRIAQGIARLEELRARLMEEEAQAGEKRRNMERWLRSLRPHEERVMRMRYIKGCKWGQIDKALHYSRGSAYKIQERMQKNGKVER